MNLTSVLTGKVEPARASGVGPSSLSGSHADFADFFQSGSVKHHQVSAVLVGFRVENETF